MQLKLIFLAGLFLLLFITGVVSATFEVAQGSTIYLGETVDISRVMSWSGQFAYFSNGIPSKTPTTIVDVNDVGHMYQYYIDPTKYCVGTWYKWDGEYEMAGNMLAFYIAPGVRNNTYISTLNEDVPKPVEISLDPITLPAKTPQDTHLLLARGDHGTLKYGLAEGANQQGYIWLFGTIADYDLTRGSVMDSGTMLGIKMNFSSGESSNSFTFTPEQSRKLQEGWYTGYIQFVGANGKQDVFYRANHKIDDERHMVLDTPYDDEYVPDVPLDGNVPIQIKQKLEKLIDVKEYNDDILVPITVEIVPPSITIGDYWEDSANIVIRGSTSMSAGTDISVMIDPSQYVMLPEIRSHTFKTVASYKDGNKEADCISEYINLNNDGYNVTLYNGTAFNVTYGNGTFARNVQIGSSVSEKTKCTSIPRVYSITIPIQWKDMAVGHHTIKSSIDAHGIQTFVTKDFEVTGEWVNPVPTREFNKLLVVREGESHLINITTGENVNRTEQFFANVTPTPTPTPSPTMEIIIVGNQTDPNSTVGVVPTDIPEPVPTPIPEPPQDNTLLLIVVAVIMIVAVIVGWLYWG